MRVPDEPVIVLTATDARILWQAAHLNDLRIKHRSGDSQLYQLLHDIYRVGQLRVAEAGSETRQSAATEEREWWTVQHLAKATRLAPRTIRLDIANNELPATKNGNTWLVKNLAATTYIASRRKN